MPLNAVFFDLDGTLLDTAPDLAKALNKLLVEKQREPLAESEVRAVVSDGANAMLKLAFNQTPDQEGFDLLRKQMLDYYLDDIAGGTTPFEGIEELINTLTRHGIPWGIVTNKPWPYAEPLMAQFNFASAPAALICPEHVSERKPAPEALFLACEKVGCEATNAVYIGDHLRDIQCGINAGMPTIAVGYGYIHADDSHLNWNARHNVGHAREIWPILQAYL